MIQLTLIELFKIIKRPRSYIGFLAIFLTVGAMQLAMYYEGEELISIAIQNLENDFRLEGKIINTNLMTYILLNSLIIHIPILICFAPRFPPLLIICSNAGIKDSPPSRPNLFVPTNFTCKYFSKPSA